MSTLSITDSLRESSGNKLYDSFQAVYQKQPLEDSHFCARWASRVGVIVASALGSVTFIPVSLPLGKVLGPIGAASNFTTFLGVDFWSAKEMINGAFGAKTVAEKVLNSSNTTNCTSEKALIISLAVMVALLAQVPHALAAMAYNEEKYKIAAGAVLLVSGAILPFRSLYLTLQKIAVKTQDDQEAEITELKERMMNLLGTCHEAFVKKSPEEKLDFIQDLPPDGDERTVALLPQYAPAQTHCIEDVFHFFGIDVGVFKDPSASCIEKLFNAMGLGFGIFLAGLSEYASANYTFVETKQQIYDNDWVAGTFAALSVSSTAYLVGLSIIKTTQRIFNVCGSGLAGKETRNLSWQLSPKLSAALTTFGFLLNVAALFPNYVIWGNFYTQGFAHEFFQKGKCLALFQLFMTSSLDIIDDLVVASLANGSDGEKETEEMSEELKKLQTLIQECPNEEFRAYLERQGNKPREIRAKLIPDRPRSSYQTL